MLLDFKVLFKCAVILCKDLYAFDLGTQINLLEVFSMTPLYLWANHVIDMYRPENASYLRYFLTTYLYYVVSIFTMYVSTSRILRWFTNFKLTGWVWIPKTSQRVETNTSVELQHCAQKSGLAAMTSDLAYDTLTGNSFQGQ